MRTLFPGWTSNQGQWYSTRRSIPGLEGIYLRILSAASIFGKPSKAEGFLVRICSRPLRCNPTRLIQLYPHVTTYLRQRNRSKGPVMCFRGAFRTDILNYIHYKRDPFSSYSKFTTENKHALWSSFQADTFGCIHFQRNPWYPSQDVGSKSYSGMCMHCGALIHAHLFYF